MATPRAIPQKQPLPPPTRYPCEKRSCQNAAPGLDSAPPVSCFYSCCSAIASNAITLTKQGACIATQTSTPLPKRAVPASINMESTLSNCYPITLPQAVPGALQLGKGGKIQSNIHPSGELLLSRVAGREADDPLLGHCLGFLVGDMANHPERLQAVHARFVLRLQSLVGGIEIDLNLPPSAHAE